MSTTKFLPFAVLALTQSIAFAQQVPSAGSQLHQIPPAPALQQVPPRLRVEQAAEPVAANMPSSTASIEVRRLRVTGARAYPEAALLAHTGFQPGSRLTLAELNTMALMIEQHYRSNGYFVAQAYLPAQDIQDGVVTIAVLEGQYGQIGLKNQTNMSDGRVGALLAGLDSGDTVMREPLEQRLLLLSDLPGVIVKSTLAPGATPGASDLLVDVQPGQRVTGSIDADNAGSRYTGAYRIGATVNLNQPFGLGDVASLRVLTSGDGLKYARAAYQLQVGRATVGAAYSRLDYKLGKEFDSLGARGTASIAGIYGSYPLIRSRDNNLYAQLSYDDKTFQDKVQVASVVNDKKVRAATIGLAGDHRDSLGGGGISNYALALTSGDLDIQTADVRAFDALTARSNGGYRKLALSASRLQSVSDAVSLYAAINGQLASKNLDVSERMELGGINGVRAYPEGEAYADQGYVLNLEARLQLPPLPATLPGQMQLIGFVDTGTVSLNKNQWAAGDNKRTLSGAGIGLSWANNNDFVVRAYYAHKLGAAVATSAPDKGGRFWIQAVKYF
ncbi:ShlB/FhaC/HecB family hemolysin secretion/activation protein [Janthinobacterium svalbardensis]|uniref:ShlB/FhaC/HecB family hemolysin secretion/activation protein n=1 Tax=Janthinobacterium svalbardensis TaxID=368607 RepID=UPI002FCDCEBB